MKPIDPETKISKVVHTRVSTDLKTRLDEESAKRCISPSNFIRNLLENALMGKRRRRAA